MSELLIPAASGEVVQFDPLKTHALDAMLTAGIEYAKKVGDFGMLETTVEKKLEEQAAFVTWWTANVSVRHAAGGHDKKRADLRSSLSMSQAERQTHIKHQQVSKWKHELRNRDAYRKRLVGTVAQAVMAEADHVRGTLGTGENEWFTPTEHIERARKVLGGIDLDPASNATANETVRAAEYFSKDSDGLASKWHGRVWLNPPYAQPAIQHFADKMVSEWQAGNVEAAVMLTHNYTDTAWFQALAHSAQALCFTRGRIRFVSPSGALAAPTQGQTFFYFGQAVDRFVETFAGIGFAAEVRQ